MDLSRIIYEEVEGVAVVSLNRPRKRNALDGATVRELRGVLVAAEGTPEVRVILLRGEGNDFCAGADLDELERLAQGAEPIANLVDAEELGELFVHMRRLRKPIVAAVHGHALAGGAGLAGACDLVLASDGARFGFPEVKLGFVPAMVLAILRRAVGEKAAFELAATGEPIDAPRALALGLVSRVFPDESFHDEALAFARDLGLRSPQALVLIKRLLYGTDGASFAEGVRRGAEVNALSRMSEETRAGVRRFLERKAEEGDASAEREA